VHSTIDLTVRKAPDPAKPVDWNKVSEDLINSMNEVANSIEQKRAILENLTKESKKIILAYKSPGYSISLNNFQYLTQTKILEVIDSFHNSLINGWIKSQDYPRYIEKVVSDYVLYVQGIENFNFSLKNKIDALMNSNDQKKISLISEKLDEIILNSKIDYSYNQVQGKRYAEIHNQSIKISYKNNSLETFAFISILSTALNVKEELVVKFDSYEELYLKGILLHNKKDYYNSWIAFNDAIWINPNSDSAICFRAQENYYLKDYFRTIIDAESAIKLNEINDKAYYWRANAKVSQNQYDDALLDFNKAILLNPKNSLYFFWRADLKKKMNDDKGALADYKQVLLLNPDDEKAFKYKILLEEKLKN
jgi:tetratricopeptide (TPR) repeat protein